MLDLPGCVLVGLLGVLLDVPFITLIAIAKSPFMLLRGWRRLLQDLVGREGPFLETVCVPVAGLAVLLWPLVVVVAVVCGMFSSVFIGLYGAVVVYQVFFNYVKIGRRSVYLDVLFVSKDIEEHIYSLFFVFSLQIYVVPL